MTVPPPTSLRSPGTLLIARSHTASRRSSGQPLFSQAEGTRGSPSLLESSLTFRHDRGARLGMLPATCERPRGLGQSERSGLRARARKRKWSVRYMLCPRVRNRGPWCFPRTVWIPITCFLTSQVEGFAISSPFCFVQPFEKRSLVGSLYLEIGGLRPSSHQKIRRSRFRIMPACAYRSTTADLRAQLAKPSPPFRPRGASKKKSARNWPETPDGENLPAPGLEQKYSFCK